MINASGAVVGRESELAATDALLDDACKAFMVLVLEGEPGIGKTTVWREALRRAAARGMPMLLTIPTQAEAALSFAGLADLFGRVDHALIERLPAPQRDALRAALLQVPAPERGIDERALCAAVLSLLRLMSAQHPMLIAVDDAQWLDTASARVLSFAVRRLQLEPIGVLTTVRTGTVRSPTFDRAAEAERHRSVRLKPLTVAALHELIKQRTGRSLGRPLMVQLASACGGNPLYALEIATQLGDQPLEAGRLPAPASLVEMVASRVKRLPAPTRSAVLMAAMLSRPTSDVVDRRALEPAERAGMVSIDAGQIRFIHPLFVSAIQNQAGTVERRRMHHQLAEVVVDPEERARHAALGAELPDADIAGELGDAAAGARSRGASAAAAELLELAIGLTPFDDENARASRRVDAAASWFNAGDLGRAQAMLEQALATPLAAPMRAHALELMGQLHARRSSFAEALAVGLQALEFAAGDAALTADLEMDVAYYSASSGDVPSAVEHAQRAAAAAEQAGSPGVLGDALAVSTIAHFMAGGGMDERRIRRARELDDPTRRRAWQNSPAFIHGNMLVYCGRLGEALSILGTLHAQALYRGEESPIPFSCFWLAWALLWNGDFAAARRRSEESRHAAALLDDPAARGMSLTTSALVHAHDGSTIEARHEALEALQIFNELGWMVGSVYARWALGLAELSDGDPAAVDAALGPLSAQLLALPGGDPFLGVFLSEQVEALVELGQLERADLCLQWLDQRATALDRPWARAAAARCQGLLCSARGDRDGALAALEEAVVQHARSDMPFELARTLLIKGRVHRRRKEKRLAREELQQALRIFEHVGAPVWSAKVNAELARLGRQPTTTDELTETEQRVAELAASGRANREIAERAFLTTKAVEANLTRVYRKLGIRSRGGLARALQAIDQTDQAQGGVIR
jgi:DNA-binding CsgD family transcriptional regulator